MSYQSIFKSSVDSGLRERVIACTVQEAWNNEAVSDSEYGKLVQVSFENASRMIWPVCISSDIEEAYELALSGGNQRPGNDEIVIPDSMIIANVQAKWPVDPIP